MDFDFIAPYYRSLEYLAFGNRLQRHRDHFLSVTRNAQSALVLGDGDGRFLEWLITGNSAVTVDSVDASHRMTALARQRIGRRLAKSDSQRVQFVEGDVRLINFPRRSYDLIASHFFLDCFDERELRQLVRRLAHHAAPGAFWIISEFQQPAAALPALHAKVWLTIMYTFFHLVARLEVKRLPDHRGILAANRFTLLDEHLSRLGFIGSELWQFSAPQE